jgi:ABC-type glycerol-3-phosphate transport system substrate-binding protein
MLTKRWIATYVAVVAILSLLAACGPTPTPQVVEKVVKETVVVEKEVEAVVEVTRVVEVEAIKEVPVELTIPLSLNPSTAILNPGDQVVISVISEEWQAAELTWELFSESEDLKSPKALSASTGPTVIYVAPEQSGEVIVSVRGKTKGGVGKSSVSFTIEPRPLGGVVEFWTFPPKVDWDSERASEFPEVYPEVLVKIVSFSPEDTEDKLWTAIAAGAAPDVVRFPEIGVARVFGEKGFLDADTATWIIREIGEDKFDPILLNALLDPVDKTRWIAVPTEREALSIMMGAANKRVAEAWVTFLIERELQRP